MGAFDRPVTTLELASMGEVRLRFLTAGDGDNLFKIVAKKDIADKAFVQAVLFHQVITPHLSEEEFSNVPDEDLKKIAEAFIENEEYTFKGYVDTGDIFSDFRKPITQSVEEDEKRIRAMFGSSITYAEQLVEGFNRSPFVDLGMLNCVDLRAITGVSEQLSAALDAVSFKLQSLHDSLTAGAKAVNLFSEYWDNYYILNMRIVDSIASTFSTQILAPQQSLLQAIQEVSTLSIKNETIFVGNIREINTYPEKQKDLLYKEARFRFFSIGDFEVILQEIKENIERNSQLMFWAARTKGRLVDNPEHIAQGLMMALLYRNVPKYKVLAFQQPRSGSGLIDIILTFPNKYGELEKIILELKVFDEYHSLGDGIEQLAQYMEHEETEYGYRVIFNATKGELVTQDRFAINGKKITDFLININLPNPSSLN